MATTCMLLAMGVTEGPRDVRMLSMLNVDVSILPPRNGGTKKRENEIDVDVSMINYADLLRVCGMCIVQCA